MVHSPKRPGPELVSLQMSLELPCCSAYSTLGPLSVPTAQNTLLSDAHMVHVRIS